DVQIGADRFARFADRISLVRFEPMQGEPVFMRVHGDGANTQLVSGPKHANGNLTAVGGQDFADRPDLFFRHGSMGVRFPRWVRNCEYFRERSRSSYRRGILPSGFRP